jgi:hypothetical protein
MRNKPEEEQKQGSIKRWEEQIDDWREQIKRLVRRWM